MQWIPAPTKQLALPILGSSCLARKAVVMIFSRQLKMGEFLLTFTPQQALTLLTRPTIVMTLVHPQWPFNSLRMMQVTLTLYIINWSAWKALDSSWGNEKKDQFWFNVNGLDQVEFGAKDVTECLEGGQVGAGSYDLSTQDWTRCVGWQKTIWN